MKQKQSTINNQQSTEIAIIGAGMVGMAQAIALADAGMDVLVIDRENPEVMLSQSYDGRVSAVAWKSYQFLDAIGAWEYILPHAQPINDIRVSDADSLFFIHFDHREIGADAFGYIVENRHIRIGLYKRAAELKSLTLQAPCEIENIDFKNKTIKLNHQLSTINYQLLIAADGKFSKTRQLAGIEISERNYKQTGIVCTIEHELPHNGLAHEKFLPAGPFAVLPMLTPPTPPNRGGVGGVSSLVWTEPSELAPIYMKMSDAEFLAEIEKRCDYLGKIKLVQGRWSYPLSLSHANNYIAHAPHGSRETVRGAQSRLSSPNGSENSAPSIVLIGDAAHSIHPIAGQGVNLGFRDVIELTNLLLERRKLGLPMSSALPEYERVRKLDNGMMIFATDTLNRLFSNNFTPLRLARDLGLGVVNEIPFLKRFFMKAASGKF